MEKFWSWDDRVCWNGCRECVLRMGDPWWPREQILVNAEDLLDGSRLFSVSEMCFICPSC